MKQPKPTSNTHDQLTTEKRQIENLVPARAMKKIEREDNNNNNNNNNKKRTSDMRLWLSGCL